jgi:hypothetical protein
MPDFFQNMSDQLSAPARSARSLTPHDSNALSDIPKALYVGTGGVVIMRGVDDSADTTWRNVPNGALLPVRSRFIRATGTTATDIIGLY